MACISSTEQNMKKRSWAQGIVFSLVGALLGLRVTYAASPQVPALPTQTAGYVQYAVTNLPNSYKAPQVAALNNTPATNPITDAGATLGRVLFYDTRLSHSNGISCSSCHKQSNGFSDPNALSTGVNGQTGRHSMALSNVAYYANGKAFWDERAASIEDQALVPIQNEVEMGSTLPEVIGKLSQTTFYPALFQSAFGTSEITSERMGKAIAQFERSMVSYQSKFDKTPGAFTADENAGRALFNGAAKCGTCHATNAHVSNALHNIGLDATTIDAGAGNGQFKAPSLRNVEVRGHFMHDGRFSTLQQVIEFYNSGIQNNQFLDPALKTAPGPGGVPIQLGLTASQMSQLEAFLKTLTDTTFLTSSLFSDPFVTLPGDYTGDGVVDVADYNLWRSSVGDTTSLVADGNSDGLVDTADYVVWRNNSGRTWLDLAIGSGALGVASIPEPAGLGLVAIALLGGTIRRRRRIN